MWHALLFSGVFFRTCFVGGGVVQMYYNKYIQWNYKRKLSIIFTTSSISKVNSRWIDNKARLLYLFWNQNLFLLIYLKIVVHLSL